MKTVKAITFTFGLILCLAFVTSASPCGKNGMTVVQSIDLDTYVFYVFRDGPDFVFQFPGKNISYPDGLKGRKRFFVDEIFFESLAVKPSDFMKVEKDATDLDILKKHQAFEVAYMQKTTTPLTKFVELGPRVKGAANQQPSFTFYLWMMVNPQKPDDPAGAKQYFLSTVSGGEVIVLSAIVPNKLKEESAMVVFQDYASSFQHILKKEQCPEKAK